MNQPSAPLHPSLPTHTTTTLGDNQPSTSQNKPITSATTSEPQPVSIGNKPCVDPDTGEWIVSEFDVECMAIGAGILGCGGGGSPYIGKLRIQQLIKSGKEIRVMHPDR